MDGLFGFETPFFRSLYIFNPEIGGMCSSCDILLSLKLELLDCLYLLSLELVFLIEISEIEIEGLNYTFFGYMGDQLVLACFL